MTVTYKNSSDTVGVSRCDSVTFDTYEEDYTYQPKTVATLKGGMYSGLKVPVENLLSIVD